MQQNIIGSEVEGDPVNLKLTAMRRNYSFHLYRGKNDREHERREVSGLNSQTGQMPCISDHAWHFAFAVDICLWSFRKDRRKVRALSGRLPPGSFGKEALVRPSLHHNLSDRNMRHFLFFFSHRATQPSLVTFSFRNLYCFCIFAWFQVFFLF